jgi:hypothetical protein
MGVNRALWAASKAPEVRNIYSLGRKPQGLFFKGMKALNGRQKGATLICAVSFAVCFSIAVFAGP